MLFRQIFDDQLAQNAYLVGCERTRRAILVDPERDVDRYLDLAARAGLEIVAVTETHVHADFLSGARELAAADRGIAVHLSGTGEDEWRYEWPERDGREWTALGDGDSIHVGDLELRAIATPGHTPEHLAFEVFDRGAGSGEPVALLSGDFVFAGDLGRPDLLESAAGIAGATEPSARLLFASARRFLERPDWLQVWPGHGAGSACGKALGGMPATTVGFERRTSPALAQVAAGESRFVSFILDGQPEPPLYFARMKEQNRTGPPLLGGLPRPALLSPARLRELASAPEVVALDTRRDRAGYFARHLRGSLFTPFNRSFPTVVGSYVEPAQRVVLLIEERELEAAVRSLVRVGIDRVEGWAPPEALDRTSAEALTATPRVEFGAELERALAAPAAVVLDVREGHEYEAAHLAGALRISHTRLAAEADRLPRNRPIYVHCETGSRAASAVSLLARRGFDARLVDGELASRRRSGRAT